MSIEDKIHSARAKVQEDMSDADALAAEATFAIGVLLGSGYAYSAMLVLSLVEHVVGLDHPTLVAIREKLGVQNA